MGNTIKLYHTDRTSTEWELIPNKLLVVEDIETYLTTKTSTTISNFQYVKNELELGIHVDLAQSYSQPLTADSFKYLSIQNTGEEIHYYFIKKAVWRSKTCVRFELVMDVLNTFKEGSDYDFKANTKISREHKDRFKINYKIKYMHLNMDNFTEGDRDIQVNEQIVIRDDHTNQLLAMAGVLDINYTNETMYIHVSVGDMSTLQTPTNVKIYSEHEDEMLLIATIVSYTFDSEVFNQIDYVAEGINPILHCGNGNGKKLELGASILQQDWYLLYRNQNEPDETLVNPVDCFLIPNEQTSVLTNVITNGQITAGTLQTDKYYYVKITGSQTLTLSNGVELDDTAIWASQSMQYAFFYKDINGMIHVDFNGVNVSYARVGVTSYVVKYITLNQLPTTYCVYTAQQNDLSGLYNDFTNNYESWTSSTVGLYIFGIDSLDRTEARNIKLIKLPYCPYAFTITSSKIDLTNGDWNYEAVGNMPALKLNELNTPLHNSFILSSEDSQPLKKLATGKSVEEMLINITSLRKGMDYEPKLLHSEFYKPTYYYDSFTYSIQLEKVDLEYYSYVADNLKLTLNFDVTRTINSKFLFTFEDYGIKYAEQNYSKVMPIARNNEEVLYNVPYINYVRTGFNYDVKAKNLQNVSNYAGLGLSAASVGASLLLPSVPLKVAGIVASLVSMAMSVKSAIVSSQQGENNLQSKILQEKNQATSVMGSDDVDLMSVYAENRLKYLIYEPLPDIMSLLFDLFFYAGYKSNRLGKPNHNTRVNFDYLECDASIQKISSIPDECLTELINCFKAGVTYLHKTSRTTNKWDFGQTYENYEKIFFEEVE